jgi:putative peptidoglycan lipid II flippase
MGRLQNAVARVNSKVPIELAAAMLADATLLSSLLGLYRERLLNRAYFDSFKVGLDAYTVAFTIPDFMYVILVSGALSVTFIPVFNQRLATGNKKSAWQLSTSLINFMALITFVASILIIIFAEPLVRYVVAPGFDEAGRNLATSMMRVLAVNPLLFAVSTVIASIQQAIGRFTFYALAPVIYNVGIIIGILYFTEGITIFGWRIFDGGIMGVALGVVLGAIMQLVISSIGLIGLGFDYQFKIFRRNKGFRRVLALLPPRALDQGADYVTMIAEINLASRFASGSIRSFQQASMLHLMPISLIGVAISTAAFPRMTMRLAQGRPDLFKKDLQSIMRAIVWLALPIGVITLFARGYVVNFAFQGGDRVVANLLGVLAVAIVFRTMYHIAARSFYAQQDTKTPLYVSIFAITLNVVLAIWFTMKLNLDIYGLALAASIVSAVEVLILFAIMSRRIPGLFDKVFIHAVARMASATGFMAVITYLSVRALPLTVGDQNLLPTVLKFGAITAISFAAYVLFCWMFRLREVNPILNKAKKLLFTQAG